MVQDLGGISALKLATCTGEGRVSHEWGRRPADGKALGGGVYRVGMRLSLSRLLANFELVCHEECSHVSGSTSYRLHLSGLRDGKSAALINMNLDNRVPP